MQLAAGLPRRPNRNALHRAQSGALPSRGCAGFQRRARLPKIPGAPLLREAFEPWV